MMSNFTAAYTFVLVAVKLAEDEINKLHLHYSTIPLGTVNGRNVIIIIIHLL